MSDKLTPVADDMIVEIDYTLRLEDGEVVDSSVEKDPLAYLHGSGQIISGLEEAISGMQAGDEKDVTVTPKDGYGEYDDEALQLVPLNVFPDDLDLQQGMELHMRHSQTEQLIRAFVNEIRPDGVVLDLNHPLAGETLFFHVKVVSVRPATESEMEHGHVHDGHTHS